MSELSSLLGELNTLLGEPPPSGRDGDPSLEECLEAEIARQEERERLRSDFWEFVKCFWNEVPGAQPLVENWHMPYLCRELQEVALRVHRGETAPYNLVVNVSPGTSKSSIVSILFPAWVWTFFPQARFLTASHTDALVLDLAEKSRALIKSEAYQALFSIEFRDNMDTKSLFANTAGGDRKACTVAGKTPTGFHAHFILIDDPLDPKKAVSQVSLKAAQFFYDNVIPSRKVNKEVSVEITLMQRLHEVDPTGYMIKRADREHVRPVRHICLPAELTCDVHPPELREHYVDGLMDINRLPAHVLRSERATMGEYGYAAQFLQSPKPLGGGMFREEFFVQRCRAAPYHARRVRYWDFAASQGAGKRTSGVLMARDAQGNIYVEHVCVGQWETFERNRMVKAMAVRDRQRYQPKNEPVIVVEEEGGSSGKDAVRYLARELHGFRFQSDKVTGDKVTRAGPWSSQLEAGTVWLVSDGTWDVQAFIDEHTLFPNGEFKDRVDSASGGYNWLSGNLPRHDPLKIVPFRKGSAPLRIVACSGEELANLPIEDPTLLVSVCSPHPVGPPDGVPRQTPLHLLSALQGFLPLTFADLRPEDFQGCWDDPVMPYDRPARELVMDNSHGKSLWAFLRKTYPVNPGVIVIQDECDSRALSLALAVCDALGHRREACIHLPSAPYNEVKGDLEPPNRHVYDVAKSARARVL